MSLLEITESNRERERERERERGEKNPTHQLQPLSLDVPPRDYSVKERDGVEQGLLAELEPVANLQKKIHFNFLTDLKGLYHNSWFCSPRLLRS